VDSHGNERDKYQPGKANAPVTHVGRARGENRPERAPGTPRTAQPSSIIQCPPRRLADQALPADQETAATNLCRTQTGSEQAADLALGTIGNGAVAAQFMGLAPTKSGAQPHSAAEEDRLVTGPALIVGPALTSPYGTVARETSADWWYFRPLDLPRLAPHRGRARFLHLQALATQCSSEPWILANSEDDLGIKWKRKLSRSWRRNRARPTVSLLPENSASRLARHVHDRPSRGQAGLASRRLKTLSAVAERNWTSGRGVRRVFIPESNRTPTCVLSKVKPLAVRELSLN